MRAGLTLVSTLSIAGALSGCDDDTSGTSTTSSSASTTTTGTATTGSAASGAQASTSASTSGGGIDCADPTGEAPALALDLVASGLSSPVQVKSAPDDPDRLYVLQQTGQVMIIEDDVVLPTPFIDIAPRVRVGGEEGLLGLAFHPDYAENGRFFLHYSASDDGDSTVTEFVRSADARIAEPAPVQTVLTFPTTLPNHNGGAIEFGLDGYLYIALGDGGNQGDPECDAQTLTSPPGDPAIVGPNYLGKILRVDVDAAPDANGYPAAPGNPAGHKAYHLGFRNPWRMSFDACTGDLFVGDVGHTSFEEIDRITVAQGPQNCGWPYVEANAPFGGGSCPPQPALLAPFAVADHVPEGHCAIAAGYVYRGTEMPGLRGSFFFGDYCSGAVWRMPGLADGGFGPAARVSSLEIGLNVSGFGQDGRGNVYVVDLNGRVYRIAP